MTDQNQKSKEDIQHIRSMMERSSRFISLNGIAGVSAGVLALIAGFYAQYLISGCNPAPSYESEFCENLPQKLMGLAFLTVFFALGSAIYFTMKKSKEKNLPIWTDSTRNLLTHFGIPLFVGFMVCMAFYTHETYQYIIPCMLVFYGLGLISASNFTFGDIKYLGICEIVLGVIGFYYDDHNLKLWMLGFGVLHIVYGIIMYRKYG